MNLQTAVHAYEKYISVHLADTSLRAYRSRLRFILRNLGEDRSLDSISRRDIDACAATYRQSRNATTTRLFIVVVQQFFRFCVEEGLITASPAARLRKPAAPRRIPRSLSERVVDQLEAGLEKIPVSYRWSDRRNVAILRFILHTGLRRGEIVALTWRDVDQVSGQVTVRGKGGRERVIPLNERARQALHLVQRNNQGAVFGHEDGRHLNAWSLDVLIKKWVSRHQLPELGLHRLRHTFATRLLARGVSLYDIRDLLGHETVRTTEIYLSANPERLRGAVEKL